MTTNDYLIQLQLDKENLKLNLEAKGVKVLDTDTFTEMSQKVNEIETGGGDLSEYFNTTPISSDTISDSVNGWLNINFLKKVPDIVIPDDITSISGFCLNYTSKIVPKIICNNNIKNFSSLYNGCSTAETIDVSGLNTENMLQINSMFSGCRGAIDLDLSNIDCSKISGVSNQYALHNMFLNCPKLKNLKYMKNVGKGYVIEGEHHNYSRVVLSACTKLTHDSLLDVINNLYDLNLTYDVANGGTLYRQKLVLSSTSIALLSDEEIAIASNKGWDITTS